MLIGNTIEYSYDGADSYRVRCEDGSATWEVLSGEYKGESRKEEADLIEVAPDIWFVSWLEPTAEVVSFVANLATMEITCSYVYGAERFLWRGKITSIRPNDQA